MGWDIMPTNTHYLSVIFIYKEEQSLLSYNELTSEEYGCSIFVMSVDFVGFLTIIYIFFQLFDSQRSMNACGAIQRWLKSIVCGGEENSAIG